MPGVPSGRGCEACRKQKKKCDERRPSCSRCTRLDIICVGSGLRRYKFKEEHGLQRQSSNGRHIQKSCLNLGWEGESGTEPPLASPTNSVTLLAQAFVSTIRLTTDLKYNLAWSYGGYLEEVPQRLGSNEALDAAADAVVSAHLSFCAHRVTSVNALNKYSRALRKLRICLDDPTESCTANTLCAVALLLVCQNFVGTGESRWTGHAEGAAQILKARRSFRPRDDFERTLLHSLRGPVLFEGIFNNNISLDSQEWAALVENELDGNSYEGQMMCSLARVPEILRVGKQNGFEHRSQNLDLRQETELLYENFKTSLRQMGAQWAAIQAPGGADGYPPLVGLRLHAHYQRLYGLGLAIGIILNHVLSAFYVDDRELMLESTNLAEEIVVLAQEAVRYRPLGATYMVLCLMAAWIGAPDKSLKRVVENRLLDYQCDFAQEYMQNLTVELEDISRHLCMRETKLA